MTRNEPASRAVVFGAEGGIGGAIATALADRGSRVWTGSRKGGCHGPNIVPFTFDLLDEASIAAVPALLGGDPPDLVIVATGVLTLPGGIGPEKSLRALDGAAMAQVLQINTIGPALIAKHMLPLLPRDRRGVFAALSARVGSIGDNRLGGWHSYRASKAALNMLLRNFAVELARTRPLAIVAGLHPGTVETALSAPFRGNLAAGQLTSPEQSAANLLAVLDRLQPADSGAVFDWRGERIEP